MKNSRYLESCSLCRALSQEFPVFLSDGAGIFWLKALTGPGFGIQLVQ
jgi:hypothetical protein